MVRFGTVTEVRKVGAGGPKQGGFVHSIGRRRRALVGDVVLENAPRLNEGKARPLIAAGLGGKLVDLHWPHLGEAVAFAAKIAGAQNELYGNAARVFGRAWESAQKIVALQLSAVPEAERTEVATRTFAALARLVDEVDGGALASALASAAGLVDLALRMKARGTLALGAADLARAGEDAVDAVLSFLARVADRRGRSSLLNVLPRFVEQLELAEGKIDAERSRAIVAKVAAALAGGTPKAGTDFAELSVIAALLSKHAKARGKADVILDAAFAEHAASRKQAIDIVRAGLGASPLDAAAGSLLDANPTAPDGLLAIVEQLVSAARPYAGQPILDHAGAVLARFAGGPAGETVARLLAVHLARAAAGAGPAGRAESDGAAIASLVRACLAGAGLDVNAYEPVLAELEALPAARAARVASVMVDAIAQGRGTPELLAASIDRARSVQGDDPLAALEHHAASYARLEQELARHPILGRDPKLTAAMIGATTIDALPRLASALATVAQHLPEARLERLIAGDERTPGLAALAEATDRPADPLSLFAMFLGDAGGAGERDPDAIARAAIRLALAVSGIRNAEAVHLPKIREDWRSAVADPGALTYAAKGNAAGVRAPRSLQGFLDAHPSLPMDLAFTAGRLSEPRLAWVIGRLETKSLDTVRFLRDAIFALAALGRLDVLDAIIASKSPPKAIAAVIADLASRFTRNALAGAPLDEIVQSLAAGGDPIASIREREVKAAFQGTDLYALAEGNVTEQGLAEIVAIAPNVADLIVQYSPGFQVWDYDKDIDMTKLLAPFLAALKDTLQGTWPRRKYEDEVNVRQLAMLTPEQRVLWRRNMVTPEQDLAVAPQPIDPTVVPLSRGLAKAVEQEVRLAHPDIPDLRWDAASKQRLAAMRDEQLAILRKVPKGTDEHRAASRAIGPVLDRLRVIELKLVLDGLANEHDPAAIARAIEPVVKQAVGSLRKLGGRGSAEVAAKIVASLPIVAVPDAHARAGAYAIDEDSLTAMIDSHKSGCLSFGDKRRRWGMCGSLTDANTKMLHTFRDGVQKYRTFLRLLPVSLPGYQGPALYIESPVGDTGGNQADRALLVKGLFAKGRAMGVPVIGADVQPPPGWTAQNFQVTLTFDWGHTGVYHSDRLSDCKAQGNGGLPVDKQHQLHVSIPPELAARIAV